MKTTCDGIEFRSRTEASWYLVLQRFGLDPIYEPETVEISTIGDDQPDRQSCWYMPDFTIQLFGNKAFVEVKAGIEGESQDIAKACILGYKTPTLIIVGWPLQYKAVLIKERHKGNPSGIEILFRSDLWNNLCVSEGRKIYLSSSYPDEDWLDMYLDDIKELTPDRTMSSGTAEGDIARDAWNATKWKR
jgi:hypothetical protein